MSYLRRLVWHHNDAGRIPISGEGLASNRQVLTEADAVWLSDMFPELEFKCQEWNNDLAQWVEVDE